jgi:hypothetical protein
MNLRRIANNFHSVSLPNGTTVWFSYETAIALRSGKTGTTIVRENVWGTTTGKHLATIDGGDKQAKEQRVTGEQFEEILASL